jgi:phosphoribosylanthranilate isomerase
MSVRGKQPPQWIAELLAARDRTRAAPTFAPDGLYFTGADYDASWELPRRVAAFRFRLADALLADRRTRVKICGITRLDDGLARAHEGADAIGFDVLAGYAAARSRQRGTRDCAALPPLRDDGGTFRRSRPRRGARDARRRPLDLLQFHGNESAELCRAFARPYVQSDARAERATKDGLLEYAARYSRRGRPVVRSPAVGRTARRHGPDVRLGCAAARACAPAGAVRGLNAENVGAAIRACGRGRSTCRAASRRSAPTASR